MRAISARVKTTLCRGPVLFPPELKRDEAFLRAHHKFKTINFVRYARKLKHLKTLPGANMAIRKEFFSRIGYFNEELGRGRSGISEDVEFAGRLLRSGGMIGYEPQAVVYHEVDWSRLTEEFFRACHRQEGVSRFLYKRQFRRSTDCVKSKRRTKMTFMFSL